MSLAWVVILLNTPELSPSHWQSLAPLASSCLMLHFYCHGQAAASGTSLFSSWHHPAQYPFCRVRILLEGVRKKLSSNIGIKTLTECFAHVLCTRVRWQWEPANQSCWLLVAPRMLVAEAIYHPFNYQLKGVRRQLLHKLNYPHRRGLNM